MSAKSNRREKKEQFIKHLRWKLFYFLNKNNNNSNKGRSNENKNISNFGFPSKEFLLQKYLIAFENNLINIINNLEVEKSTITF